MTKLKQREQSEPQEHLLPLKEQLQTRLVAKSKNLQFLSLLIQKISYPPVK